ncbi:MAG: RidA family protein, partial [Myxococcota bacterium]
MLARCSGGLAHDHRAHLWPGRDAEGRFLGDLRAQAERTYENLRRSLEAAGASPEDVVEEVLFVVGYSPWPARSKLWGKALPASTVLGVQ